MRIKLLLAACLATLVVTGNAWSLNGTIFNPAEDILWDEMEPKILGPCFCKHYKVGIELSYWEPFMAIDTVKTPHYYPFLGEEIWSGASRLGGTNSSQDSSSVDQYTTVQAHAWPLPFSNLLATLVPFLCSSPDTPAWISEFDPLWQNDMLATLIHPESLLLTALPELNLLCIPDAVSVNTAGKPLDFLPYCIGSSGIVYPVTGHVNNDDIAQVHNTGAARLLYMLNFYRMICDPALTPCGCKRSMLWTKSNYKLHVVRPRRRSPAKPIGVSSLTYSTGLNAPASSLGPNDEFLWTVYRKQLCCTCCD